MNSLHIKPFLTVAVLVLTIAAFAYYFAAHPSALRQLAHVPPLTLIILLGLYVCVTAALVFVYEALMALCDTRLDKRENFLLTAYSSIINFFGPLQSGPGFRAVYLKKRHGTKLKNYTLASMTYYGLYAACSGLFLLSGLLGWRLSLVVAATGFLMGLLLLRSTHPQVKRLRQLRLGNLYKLAVATFAQLTFTALIYYVELRAIDQSVHIGQAVVYAGVANLALFVSITPGAIGFREAFLLFSGNLHHIERSTVLAASLIDRSIYVAFLGLLFVVVLSMHAKKRLDALQNNQS